MKTILTLSIFFIIHHSSFLISSASAHHRRISNDAVYVAQNDRPGPSLVPSPQVPAFDLLAFRTPRRTGAATDDSVRVDFYLAVPYSMLEMIYAGDRYVGQYSVTLDVMDRETEKTVVDQYRAYSVVESPSDRHQRAVEHEARADAEQFSFVVAPLTDRGTATSYTVRLSIHDLSSNHDYDTSFEYRAPDVVQRHTSDLMIYRQRKGMTIVPSIGDDISSISAAGAGVFAELYDMPADSTVGIVAEVTASDAEYPAVEDIAARSTEWLQLPTGRSMLLQTPVFVPLAFDQLWMGKYRIRLFVLRSASDTSLIDWRALEHASIATVERTVIVRTQRGIPIAAADLDQALEQLRLIATGSEWDSLATAQNTKEKRDAILDFWHKRSQLAQQEGVIANDPYHDDRAPMQVFYERVQYANEHFSSGFQPGWKSDRGRVYIALGPPVNIESHPYEALQKPYEIWEYNAPNARYTFVDQYMLGDYRLIGPPPPPGTFNWNR